jgi:hypothetical protein
VLHEMNVRVQFYADSPEHAREVADWLSSIVIADEHVTMLERGAIVEARDAAAGDGVAMIVTLLDVADGVSSESVANSVLLLPYGVREKRRSVSHGTSESVQVLSTEAIKMANSAVVGE